MGFKICVVGLGLMGASMARALKGFKDAHIVGTDTDAYTREKALATDTVAEAYEKIGDAMTDADLVIFCVYSEHIPKMLEDAWGHFKAGAVLTDICGVKHSLYGKIRGILPENVTYIGIHPMAGKERDGIDNAVGSLFQNTGFIICPLDPSEGAATELMKSLAAHIGATRVSVAPYEKHDDIIAYTSDLMHIASCALCMDYPKEMTSAYTAGAFRDCTRIADINAEAWSGMLMENAGYILPFLDAYIENLSQIRATLDEKNRDSLLKLLETSRDNKREMLQK